MSSHFEDESLPFRVTIYTSSHNYAKYLPEALKSIESQSLKEWELLLFDDGSSDETAELMEQFAKRYPERVRFIQNAKSKGLRSCANRTIEEARGRFVIRLDADDYFDENALLVLASYLEHNSDVAMVYPNFTYVDENGRVLGVEMRKKLGEEDKILDLPAHGACTMVRRHILRKIGGYDEEHDTQDGYELSLKVKQRYKVGNVTTPLFFYRQHPASLSRDEQRILDSRQRIKRKLASANNRTIKQKIAGIVPVKNTYEKMPNVALRNVAGRPLIDYTIEAAEQSKCFDVVLVSTDDPLVVEYCKNTHPELFVFLRPKDLSNEGVMWSEVLFNAVEYLEEEVEFCADILVLLSVHAPLRQSKHIQQVIDSLLLTDVDSVLSVYEDFDRHFVHGEFGLTPVSHSDYDQLRFEREMFFVDNNAIRAMWRHTLTNTDYIGRRVSHVVMPRQLSFQIRTNFDIWMVGKIIESHLLLEKNKSRSDDS